jgi:leucyl-tRNA synthetase
MSRMDPDTPGPPSARPDAAGDDVPPHRYTAALAAGIERRWQAWWESHGTFRVPNPGEAGFDAAKPKFYCLDMFPYPSGAGLHVGHPEGYTATDIVSRYKRMTGHRVLHPMGWDAFGLPAEQYAIQTGVHPAETTRKAIETFRRQLKRFGFCYDWSREVATIDPAYYQWTQWIFLRLYHSWYDRSRDRARPVSELVAGLEAGTYAVSALGDVVYLPEVIGAPIAGEPVGVRRWHELTQEERRSFIDSQRLAYVDEQVVNWCPKLGTALANEEVIDGKSERGGYPVYRRPLRQWMLRITAYAERLLKDLSLVDWPASTRTQQEEWIGRSEGAEIDFPLEGDGVAEYRSVRVFTTRPDTIFGATYLVVAPEHPLIDRIVHKHAHSAETPALRSFVHAARAKSDVERQAERGGALEKTGVFTGVYARNPATGARIPVWTADYVLMGYGHGAIMAVPAHDQRDFDFALAFNLPIQAVVMPDDAWLAANRREEVPQPGADLSELRQAYAIGPHWFRRAFEGDGRAINSESAGLTLTGLATAEAKRAAVEWLEREGIGSRKVQYRLRDWLFSRQRYWGEPFPIVWDERGDHHAVGDWALPVRLPALADFAPEESSEPRPLLAKASDWVNTTAGAAGVPEEVLPAEAPVRRETNTMPNWAGSCWYYLRFCDPANGEAFCSPEAQRAWMGEGERGGVDLYIGGNEHAVLHLLYARFWHKVLYDLGLVTTPEPFRRLFHQGLITAYAYKDRSGRTVPVDEVEERDGRPVLRTTGEPVEAINAKMSKTLKNVVNPDDVIAQYGADTFRLYEMSMGPLEASKPWNTRDIVGSFRFLQRFWRNLVDERTGRPAVSDDEPDEATLRLLHRTIAGVRKDIESLSFNTAIAKLIELNNHLTTVAAQRGLPRAVAEPAVLLLSPFAPHMADELWSLLGRDGSTIDQPFPAADPALAVDATIEIPVSVMGKVRGHIRVPRGADEKAIEAAALAEPKVAALVAGKAIRRVIVVPGKMVNIVTG